MGNLDRGMQVSWPVFFKHRYVSLNTSGNYKKVAYNMISIGLKLQELTPTMAPGGDAIYT